MRESASRRRAACCIGPAHRRPPRRAGAAPTVSLCLAEVRVVAGRNVVQFWLRPGDKAVELAFEATSPAEGVLGALEGCFNVDLMVRLALDCLNCFVPCSEKPVQELRRFKLCSEFKHATKR